jgi:hypothetical protein
MFARVNWRERLERFRTKVILPLEESIFAQVTDAGRAMVKRTLEEARVHEASLEERAREEESGARPGSRRSLAELG